MTEDKKEAPSPPPPPPPPPNQEGTASGCLDIAATEDTGGSQSNEGGNDA